MSENWEFTRRERAFLIDAMMVFIHQFKRVPENDLSELPELEALQNRLMNGEKRAPLPLVAALFVLCRDWCHLRSRYPPGTQTGITERKHVTVTGGDSSVVHVHDDPCPFTGVKSISEGEEETGRVCVPGEGWGRSETARTVGGERVGGQVWVRRPR